MSFGSVRVSVVIPVRDDPRIDDLLASLAAQRDAPPFEVLVALDGAARTPRWPAGLPGRTLPGTPRGPYAARNRGIGEASGDIVLLTDSDCLCPPDWVRVGAVAFEDPALRALQGGSLPAEDTRLSLWIQREYERYVGSHAATAYRRFCNTRNLGLRRILALALPFRETFPRGGDGVYGLALEREGVTIRYAPDWAVLHRHPRSWWKEGQAAFDQGRQGALWRAEGFDLFGDGRGQAERGAGAWLLQAVPENRVAKRLAGAGLLGLAAAFGLASAALPGELGYRAFSRFRRAAHLAGRFRGESERRESAPR